MNIGLFLADIYRHYCCVSSDVLPDANWRPGRRLPSSFEKAASSVTLRASVKKTDSSPFLCKNDQPCNTSPAGSPSHQLLNSGRPPLFLRVPSMTDVEFTMPEMSTNSSILSQCKVSSLFLSLSPRLRLYPWTLLYSITRDGCSLKNLYKRLEEYDQALLLLILDTRKTAFGAVLSGPNLKLRGNIYTGTPETFLFSFFPKLRKFNASGENNYFVQSNLDGISIGGWRPGLWVDSNLEKGTTDVSPTFDNTPLTDENFIIRELECWALCEPQYTACLKTSRSTDSIHLAFPSALLAAKRPQIEVGGVRCGRLSRNYRPTFVRECSLDKTIFTLGEDDCEEAEINGINTSVFQL